MNGTASRKSAQTQTCTAKCRKKRPNAAVCATDRPEFGSLFAAATSGACQNYRLRGTPKPANATARIQSPALTSFTPEKSATVIASAFQTYANAVSSHA